MIISVPNPDERHTGPDLRDVGPAGDGAVGAHAGGGVREGSPEDVADGGAGDDVGEPDGYVGAGGGGAPGYYGGVAAGEVGGQEGMTAGKGTGGWGGGFRALGVGIPEWGWGVGCDLRSGYCVGGVGAEFAACVQWRMGRRDGWFC